MGGGTSIKGTVFFIGESNIFFRRRFGTDKNAFFDSYFEIYSKSKDFFTHVLIDTNHSSLVGGGLGSILFSFLARVGSQARLPSDDEVEGWGRAEAFTIVLFVHGGHGKSHGRFGGRRTQIHSPHFPQLLTAKPAQAQRFYLVMPSRPSTPLPPGPRWASHPPCCLGEPPLCNLIFGTLFLTPPKERPSWALLRLSPHHHSFLIQANLTTGTWLYMEGTDGI